MHITDIVKILENKVQTLEMNKSAAFQTGDLNIYNSIDLEIFETKQTIEQLNITILNENNII